MKNLQLTSPLKSVEPSTDQEIAAGTLVEIQHRTVIRTVQWRALSEKPAHGKQSDWRPSAKNSVSSDDSETDIIPETPTTTPQDLSIQPSAELISETTFTVASIAVDPPSDGEKASVRLKRENIPTISARPSVKSEDERVAAIVL